MIQTRSSSSRQTSMKWFPVPSVPTQCAKRTHSEHGSVLRWYHSGATRTRVDDATTPDRLEVGNVIAHASRCDRSVMDGFSRVGASRLRSGCRSRCPLVPFRPTEQCAAHAGEAPRLLLPQASSGLPGQVSVAVAHSLLLLLPMRASRCCAPSMRCLRRVWGHPMTGPEDGPGETAVMPRCPRETLGATREGGLHRCCGSLSSGFERARAVRGPKSVTREGRQVRRGRGGGSRGLR